MENKRLAVLPLSKVVLDGTSRDFFYSVPGVSVSQGAIQTIMDRCNEALRPWYEGFVKKSTDAGSLELAQSLLSLLNSTYLLLQKQSWQSSAGAAFCFFPGMAASGKFFCCRKRDAL